jgi:hypothetical protein
VHPANSPGTHDTVVTVQFPDCVPPIFTEVVTVVFLDEEDVVRIRILSPPLIPETVGKNVPLLFFSTVQPEQTADTATAPLPVRTTEFDVTTELTEEPVAFVNVTASGLKGIDQNADRLS